MISVIISSADKRLLSEVSINIQMTIGVPYEIISTDNSLGKKGICEVYNDLALKAKYDILCFMHEDLDLKTYGWGLKVLKIFNNERIGLLGVAGCAYKSFAPSGWDTDGNEGEVKFINYIQGYKSFAKESTKIYFNSTGENTSAVACVDGMWLCTRKSIALKYGFDHVLLKGFHGYDIDFCLSVGQEYQVAVSFDILMEHFSEGSFNKDWLIEILKVHRKWQHILPVTKRYLSDAQQLRFEKRAYKRLLKNMVNFGFRKREIFDVLMDFKKSNKSSSLLLLKLCFYLLRL